MNELSSKHLLEGELSEAFLQQELGISGVKILHTRCDVETQLQAVIAIHNTQLGPALGGCRCLPYHSQNDAILDAVKLAQGMSYKSAIAGLSYGGGKAVLLRPDMITDRAAYFEAFGDFVESLHGEYITAEDSGTSVSDMDLVAHRTKHVCGTSADRGDPSPYTALGVFYGMQSAIRFINPHRDIADCDVAIQGLGNVGYHLAKQLHQHGARLIVADIDEAAVQRCVDEFDASHVASEAIYDVDCDVFAPCALGGAINTESIARLKAPVIAGSANNQLAGLHERQLLVHANILYAPDYVINAGGLIYLTQDDEALRQQKIQQISATLEEIFDTAMSTSQSTESVAEQMAKKAINASATADQVS